MNSWASVWRANLPVFPWLLLGVLFLADLMLFDYPLYSYLTIPALIASMFAPWRGVLLLGVIALGLSVFSSVRHGVVEKERILLRLGSVAAIGLVALAISVERTRRRKTAAAGSVRAIEESRAPENDGSATPRRPLVMERRKPRDAGGEMELQIHELELLAQRLLRIQEQHQQTVSRELHDNVAQVLSAVTNRISLARTTEKLPAWLRQELFDLQRDLNSALDDVRTLAREMRPALLDHCGFAAALEKHAEAFRERTRMTLEAEIDPDAARTLDSEHLTHLFRLAQEALQNVEEHSQASRAWLRLGQLDGNMHLEIGDNGRGFTEDRVTEAQRDGHLGLLGMRERAELLGGSFLLEAVPSQGTFIRVTIPPPAKIDLTTNYENNLSPHS